jgi:hypothetical protein
MAESRMIACVSFGSAACITHESILEAKVKEGIDVALTSCKECGHQVSDQAAVCPECGCPTDKQKGDASDAGGLWWIVGAAVLGLIVWVSIGMPGLQIKSGTYVCKDEHGGTYLADVLDREILQFGRTKGDRVVTVAHKSIQRTALTSSKVFDMDIEGGDTVTCTWREELSGKRFP